MRSSAEARPRRRAVLAALAALTSLAAWVCAGQLLLGRFTPPLTDLEPLGLETWRLPGLWLAGSVAVPCLVVAVAAWRGSPHTARWSAVAASLLLLELAVQLPFVGPDPLQGVMAAVAVAIALLGRPPKMRGAVVTS